MAVMTKICFYKLVLIKFRRVLKVAALKVLWKKSYLGSKEAVGSKVPLSGIGLMLALNFLCV